MQPRASSSHEQQSQHDSSNNNNDKQGHLPFQTPPIRPTPPSQQGLKGRKSSSSQSFQKMSARRKISPMPVGTTNPPLQATSEEDEDYHRFVQSLGEDGPLMDDALQSLLVDEDEEDFVLTDLEEEEDDDDDDMLGNLTAAPSSPTSSTNNSLPASPLLLEHPDFYSELEAELGSLLEEDLEAAVSTLLGGTSNNTKTKGRASPKDNVGATTPIKKLSTAAASSSPNASTPLRESSSTSKTHTLVTPVQVQRLQRLMESHYQLLVQSSVLSVRAARKEYPEESPLVFHGGESPEDLTEILDGAVGMLQDLDQNRKDAIRNYIQRCETTPQAQRSLLSQLKGSTNKRLTRSAFHSLQESTNAQTIFDVDGLYSLKQTFRTIDHVADTRVSDGLDILQPIQHFDACRQLLEQAGAKIDEELLPGKKDVGNVVCDAREVFGDEYKPPTTVAQQIQLRKNRNQFTAAEDNLILRGVNLYGEKQWILIADRYLPDRSVNIISQRYSKLCLLLYKAHGVKIDDQGNLETPPRFEKVDQLDEVAISKIKPASAPAILNVHRWSIEEDVTLLKAVPLLGNQWAELSSRCIPHRDRGHLRKRYQVLERRVKATVTRSKRGEAPPMIPRSTPASVSALKPASRTTTKQSRKRKEPAKPVMQQSHPASIIRGPMPGHLLCPSNANGPKPGAKPAGRKTMDFPVRRSPDRRSFSSDGGGYAHANGEYSHNSGRTAQSNSGGYAHASPELDISHEASRFENILSETTNDWSQLSRMKRMMDNETESMVANAIVNNLATGSRDPPLPARTVERLPEMEAHASSGLSMLHGNSNAEGVDPGRAENSEDPETPPKQQNGSILASVLERTRKDEPLGAATGGTNDQKMDAPAPVPSTPSRPQCYPLSSYGTPLGVSPGPGIHMRTFFSPGGHKNGESPGLMGFSPAHTHSLMMGAVPSTNDYELYPFELTEASRQALEDSAGTSTIKPEGMGDPHTPSNVDMFHDSHGLKSTDLEAISALNSLSNSPAKFLKQKQPASDMTNDDENGKSNTGTVKQSLFAAAVGAVEQKESDRKKRRTTS